MNTDCFPKIDPILHNLNLQIERHLSDPELTVNRLLRLVGASRTDLFRKTKSATGMSVKAYIRYRRLRHAARLLLLHPRWTLSRVAFAVGYESQSYFSRAFKAEFGVCPSKYCGE